MQNIGKLMVFAGLILVAAGLLYWLFGNRFGWFGNLFGDIKVERENFKFYAPITSMLLLSLLLSLVLWLAGRFMK